MPIPSFEDLTGPEAVAKREQLDRIIDALAAVSGSGAFAHVRENYQAPDFAATAQNGIDTLRLLEHHLTRHLKTAVSQYWDSDDKRVGSLRKKWKSASDLYRRIDKQARRGFNPKRQLFEGMELALAAGLRIAAQVSADATRRGWSAEQAERIFANSEKAFTRLAAIGQAEFDRVLPSFDGESHKATHTAHLFIPMPGETIAYVTQGNEISMKLVVEPGPGRLCPSLVATGEDRPSGAPNLASDFHRWIQELVRDQKVWDRPPTREFVERWESSRGIDSTGGFAL